MNRALPALLSLSILGGCSNSFGLLLFEGADTGLIDSARSDDSGDGGQGGGVAPTLSGFTAEEDGERVRFSFRATDADDDLNGGTVKVTLGGAEHSFAYPSEVSLAGDGSASVTVNASSLDRGRDYDCTLVVTDRAAHRSDTARATLTLGPWSVEVDENGDTPADITGIGRIEVPAIVSGDVYRSGNNGAEYTADIDVVKFTVPQTGSYSVILQWTATGADYDLFLMETGPITIDSAAASSTNPPEVTSGTLRTGVDYFFAVGAWSGPGGAWTVRIE